MCEWSKKIKTWHTIMRFCLSLCSLLVCACARASHRSWKLRYEMLLWIHFEWTRANERTRLYMNESKKVIKRSRKSVKCSKSTRKCLQFKLWPPDRSEQPRKKSHGKKFLIKCNAVRRFVAFWIEPNPFHKWNARNIYVWTNKWTL